MATFWERAANSVDHMFSLYFAYLVIYRFGFEGGIWVLIAPVPGHCILVTLVTFKINNIVHEKLYAMQHHIHCKI